jgi:hypothetical protein
VVTKSAVWYLVETQLLVTILFMKVKGWGGKMKNSEEWRRIVQESKVHPKL